MEKTIVYEYRHLPDCKLGKMPTNTTTKTTNACTCGALSNYEAFTDVYDALTLAHEEIDKINTFVKGLLASPATGLQVLDRTQLQVKFYLEKNS